MNDFRHSGLVAKMNGLQAEEYVERRLCIECCRTALIDSWHNDAPLEVKSCQMYQTDRTSYSTKRRGRFIISKRQHAELMKESGSYVFVVFNYKYEILLAKLVKASDIDKELNHFCSGSYKLPWSTIFSEVQLL
jgi:hypothetical protein